MNDVIYCLLTPCLWISFSLPPPSHKTFIDKLFQFGPVIISHHYLIYIKCPWRLNATCCLYAIILQIIQLGFARHGRVTDNTDREGCILLGVHWEGWAPLCSI